MKGLVKDTCANLKYLFSRFIFWGWYCSISGKVNSWELASCYGSQFVSHLLHFWSSYVLMVCEKQWKMAKVFGILPLMWATLNRTLAPGFHLGQSWPFRLSGDWANWWKFCLSVSSYLRWLQGWGMTYAKARIQELHLSLKWGCRGTGAWVIFHFFFQAMIKVWMLSGATVTCTNINMWCQHYRWYLFPLHNSRPQKF